MDIVSLGVQPPTTHFPPFKTAKPSPHLKKEVLQMEVRSTITFAGRLLNDIISFFIFSALDLLDIILCLVYRLADYTMEATPKPCYCSPSVKDMVISENGDLKIVQVNSSSKLQLEDISDTLYSRSSLLSDIYPTAIPSKRSGPITKYTVNPTIVEMLQRKIGGKKMYQRWSDCHCKDCTSWCSPPRRTRSPLYVHAQGPKDGSVAKEDVLFIHGFISSSAFWTETVFPNFSESTRSKYRLFAIDLLGFGRSPKPTDSLYTLREHVEMIGKSVIEEYKVKSFHIVAHSLGSILALALAVKYPDQVQSLTLLAPPYFPVPKGKHGSQYVLRKMAPRKVWPLIVFGASLACWYEHISRTICLLVCRNHRLWVFLFKFITRNRMKTFLLEGFFCHTHNAAWHTLHNVICGSSGKINKYLDIVRDRLKCSVTVIHGKNDDVVPVDCSIAVKTKIPRANLKIIDDKDHITINIGRQKEFARELEEIWSNNAQRH